MQPNTISLPRPREDRSPAYNTLNILIAAQQACQALGIPPATFGRRAAGDPRLITDMENGRVLRPETEARVRAFITNIGVAAPGRPKKRAEPVRFHTLAPIDTTLMDVLYRKAMTKGSVMLLAAIKRERGEA